MTGALLYEQLADDLAGAIRKGSLRPGDRMPSVRGLATQRKVAVATVLQAYVRLEDDGFIEVRPRSGHFVKSRPTTRVEEPRAPRRNLSPATVSVTPGVRALMESMRDPHVVPLGAAQVSPTLLPIRQLNRRLAAIARELQDVGASYGDTTGVLTLRRQLARRSVDWGLSLHESELVITVGAMEALHLALRAVAKPGDAVAVESPTYFGVLQAVEQLGLKAIEVPSRPRQGLDLDALGEVLKSGPVKAVVAAPNVSNPGGAVMSDEDKERLVRLCARFDVPLIEDDVYGDLAWEGRPRSALSWDRDGHVLHIGSVSKTLAPGYRIGWIVGGRYQERIERLKYALTVSTPPLLQMAVAEFLASGGYDRHLRRLRRQLQAQVERTRAAVAHSFPAGTRISAPAGGFVLWVELPPGVDAYTLQTRALERGISIAPGPIFSPRERYTNHIRLSCGFPWSDRTAQAIATVGTLAAALARR
ncbi:MAG: PLP-dependent aminotransferase family protein [Myxococcota bacterium]